MSEAITPKPRILSGKKSRISIVAAKFNEQFTEALIKNAVGVIQQQNVDAKVDLVRVPGAFEIPIAAQAIIKQEKPDCVIALGCIIRGGTGHADLVAESVTRSLLELSLQTETPIIHEVLLVDDEQQAYARCVGTRLNRGRDAAYSALDIMGVLSEIRQENQSRRLHPSNA